MERDQFVNSQHPESELTSRIIRCAFVVLNEFGFGFLEAVYRKAMAVELIHCGIPTQQEVDFFLLHRTKDVGLYRADLVVAERVIVEIKTGLIPDPVGPQLTLNYLKASTLQVGLFIRRLFRKRRRNPTSNEALTRQYQQFSADFSALSVAWVRRSGPGGENQ